MPRSSLTRLNPLDCYSLRIGPIQLFPDMSSCRDRLILQWSCLRNAARQSLHYGIVVGSEEEGYGVSGKSRLVVGTMDS